MHFCAFLSSPLTTFSDPIQIPGLEAKRRGSLSPLSLLSLISWWRQTGTVQNFGRQAGGAVALVINQRKQIIYSKLAQWGSEASPIYHSLRREEGGGRTGSVWNWAGTPLLLLSLMASLSLPYWGVCALFAALKLWHLPFLPLFVFVVQWEGGRHGCMQAVIILMPVW